tara:strand:- start:7900 stop:8049 length:150 start_codon:yes stop_codon:yes gene_type:complete
MKKIKNGIDLDKVYGGLSTPAMPDQFSINKAEENGLSFLGKKFIKKIRG